jgi:hypothetical protein
MEIGSGAYASAFDFEDDFTTPPRHWQMGIAVNQRVQVDDLGLGVTMT